MCCVHDLTILIFTFSVNEQEKAAVGLSAILPIYQKTIGIEIERKEK